MRKRLPTTGAKLENTSIYRFFEEKNANGKKIKVKKYIKHGDRPTGSDADRKANHNLIQRNKNSLRKLTDALNRELPQDQQIELKHDGSTRAMEQYAAKNMRELNMTSKNKALSMEEIKVIDPGFAKYLDNKGKTPSQKHEEKNENVATNADGREGM